MKRIRSTMLFVLCGILLAGSTAEAQPNLNFKRVTVNWPVVELYFAVGCNGQPAYNMAQQDFRILENGREIKNFTLSCPDPTVRASVSAALVFDASGSMFGSGNAGAKQAGRAFVDLMDGVVDQATIIYFNAQVVVSQQMTTLKPLLYSAVDALPAGGFTAVWDGCHAGIVELINKGVNQSRFVILMTDGVDNSSTHTPAEVIDFANNNQIRVFTVGLGATIDAAELEMMALMTGGRYYQTPNAGQLAAIYQEISTIVYQGFQECVITYEPDCADGEMHSVELQLVNFCGGTDVKTKNYIAPLDSTTFTDLYMELGDATVTTGSDIRIPLNLVTPLNNEILPPFSFTLLVDQHCTQFVDVSAPSGSLLHGVPLTVTPYAGGAQIAITGGAQLSGSGMLLEIQLHAADPQDTTCCEIRATDAAFTEGCFVPDILPGEICIIPGQPVITCEIPPPLNLIWAPSTDAYVPNPFSLRERFSNSGAAAATNARYRITYDADYLQLLWPISDEQTGVPPDIAPGNFGEVSWMMAAKRRTQRDSTEMCITGMFDNHGDVTCCWKIYFPQIGAIINCALDLPVAIEVDTVNGRYDPMPFPVTVYVGNNGGMPTDSVFATIVVPPDLRLAGPDAPDQNTKRLFPPLLQPQQMGSAQWMVEHPLTTEEKQYMIQVWVKTANADSTLCEVMFTIPAIDTLFAFTLEKSGPVSFCEGDSVILSAPAGYASYAWSTGETNRTLLVTSSGSYFCTLTTVAGWTGYSDTVVVTTHPLPPKPVIDRAGDVLTTTAATQYQWLLDGSAIAGGTNQFHVATQTGSYRVRVANEHGCTSISDEFSVTVLGVDHAEAPESPQISVYPDPAGDAVTVAVDMPRGMTGNIWMIDMLGRVERILTLAGDHAEYKMQLDLTGRARGLYHIVVRSAMGTQVRKFMKR